jgi:hypothetical protein
MKLFMISAVREWRMLWAAPLMSVVGIKRKVIGTGTVARRLRWYSI